MRSALAALRAAGFATLLFLAQASCADAPPPLSPQLPQPVSATAPADICGELGDAGDDCPTVTATDIGALIETDWSEALFVNNRGQVVGFYSDPVEPGFRAFFWEDGVLTKLGTLGGVGGGFPRALNNRGQVVGEAYAADEAPRAFLWEKGVMRDLGTLGGGASGATAVNDHGVVVGVALTANDEWHLFRWENGVMSDLGGTDVGGPTVPYYAFINNSGVISGWGTFEGDPVLLRAFRWEKGVFTRLPMPEEQPEWLEQVVVGMNSRGEILGWTPALTIWRGEETTTFADWPAARAIAINDAGQVLFSNHGAYLMQGARVTPLGSIHGHDLEAKALNAVGQVAANAAMPDGNLRAVLWDRGKAINLGALDGVSSVANGLNDAGVVAGYVQTAHPRNRAVIWSVTGRGLGNAH